MDSKKIALIIITLLIVGVIFYLESQKVSPQEGAGIAKVACLSNSQKESKFDCYEEISTPDGFINVESLEIGDLIGQKVVLVDFWTYSCINCQRTQPYLNAWYEKYNDQGLKIIGIHTPEFEFEKKYENVLAAAKSAGIEYPVILDNDFSTWRAYKNRYWPRKYLIDIDGYIIYDHIGEGGYEETERKIQEALEERKEVLKMEDEISKDIATPKGVITPDSSKVRSPEVYFGAARNEYLANGQSGATGVQSFTTPREISPNALYLVGDWDINSESARSASNNSKIIFYYNAKNVYMVASSEKGVSVNILNDGEVVKTVTVKNETLYPIIENSDYGGQLLEIEIPEAGLEVFTFTFG